MTRKGIQIRIGQTWTVTKGIRKLFKKLNNSDIGDRVVILSHTGGDGLILVRDIETGVQYDLTPQNLSSLESQPM